LHHLLLGVRQVFLPIELLRYSDNDNPGIVRGSSLLYLENCVEELLSSAAPLGVLVAEVLDY